jgi:hypothetical protein
MKTIKAERWASKVYFIYVNEENFEEKDWEERVKCFGWNADPHMGVILKNSNHGVVLDTETDSDNPYPKLLFSVEDIEYVEQVLDIKIET